jgi:hypothetical protein
MSVGFRLEKHWAGLPQAHRVEHNRALPARIAERLSAAAGGLRIHPGEF